MRHEAYARASRCLSDMPGPRVDGPVRPLPPATRWVQAQSQRSDRSKSSTTRSQAGLKVLSCIMQAAERLFFQPYEALESTEILNRRVELPEWRRRRQAHGNAHAINAPQSLRVSHSSVHDVATSERHTFAIAASEYRYVCVACQET